MRSSSSLAYLPVLLVLGLCSSPSHVSAASLCKEVRQAEVEGREFLQPNAKYNELKTRVLQQCMVDAVKQTLGTEVRHRASSSTTMNNDQASDKFNELSYEKAKGSVLSYKVVKEDIQKMGEMMVLVIKVTADICVPDESELQTIIKVGSFKMPGGRENPSMYSIMEAAFPANRKFVLMPASREDIPYDILLTGEVVSFKSVVENRAAATRVLGETYKGDLGRLFQSMSKNMDPHYQNVKAVVTLTAKRVAEDETISKTVEVSKDLNIQTDPNAVLELMAKEGIEKAMKELAKRLADEEASGH